MCIYNPRIGLAYIEVSFADCSFYLSRRQSESIAFVKPINYNHTVTRERKVFCYCVESYGPLDGETSGTSLGVHRVQNSHMRTRAFSQVPSFYLSVSICHWTLQPISQVNIWKHASNRKMIFKKLWTVLYAKSNKLKYNSRAVVFSSLGESHFVLLHMCVNLSQINEHFISYIF